MDQNETSTTEAEDLLSQLDASDAICGKADPPPWDTPPSSGAVRYLGETTDQVEHRDWLLLSGDHRQVNLEFAIHARTALPDRNRQCRELLARVAELERQNASLRTEVAELRFGGPISKPC